MINKIFIEKELIRDIQSSLDSYPWGSLLGRVSYPDGVAKIYEALPAGWPDTGSYRTVGTWGIDLKKIPEPSGLCDIFLYFKLGSKSFKAYKVTAQGVSPLREVIIIRTYSDLFKRVKGIFDNRVMFKKRVAVIGLGSVGSLISLELAKAGVGEFVVFDPDRLALNNICRHIGDIDDLGRYKTNVVKEKILRRNPEAWVKTSEEDILMIREEIIHQDLKDVDLLVAATDSKEANFFINELALDLKIPLLQIGLYERASWGHIIYVIPDKTPCLGCVLPDLTEIEGQIPKEDRIIDYSHALDATQIKAEPGLGVDIGFVSMAAAKVALAILLKNHPASTLGGILQLDKNLLVVANTPGSIFPETKAFQTHWVKTAVREDCEWCRRDKYYKERYGKEYPELQRDVQTIVDNLHDSNEALKPNWWKD